MHHIERHTEHSHISLFYMTKKMHGNALECACDRIKGDISTAGRNSVRLARADGAGYSSKFKNNNHFVEIRVRQKGMALDIFFATTSLKNVSMVAPNACRPKRALMPAGAATILQATMMFRDERMTEYISPTNGFHEFMALMVGNVSIRKAL